MSTHTYTRAHKISIVNFHAQEFIFNFIRLNYGLESFKHVNSSIYIFLSDAQFNRTNSDDSKGKAKSWNFEKEKKKNPPI